MGSTLQRSLVIAGFSLVFALPAQARESERFYLSGTGPRDARPWEFRIDSGQRAGEPTTIPVPSQWQLEGFGTYAYGHEEDQPRGVGKYRLRFRVPESFRDRYVELVFEGVMTDAEARLNGQLAGPVHQGGFTRFRYDVSRLLSFEGENRLEVTVREHSSDRSVNLAERDADYWIFGGIYRPVYLEATPRTAIAHLAIDARHGGALRVHASLRGLERPGRVVAQVETLGGEPVGSPFSVLAPVGDWTVILTATLPGGASWSAEDPRLYRLVVKLVVSGQVEHEVRERFGFRTFEIRAGEGLFVNDRRVLLKGVNRHSFWPASGRALDPEVNRRDAELIRAMNLNAVRTAHYPPDPDFLDACDELGLYVLDELPGWHDAYDTAIGRRLVAEMVTRDLNHPSILFWTNGNEGGWNTDLDAEFARHDPQGRPVLHPQESFSGIDTIHYPTWEELRDRLDPHSLRNRFWGLLRRPPLVMPTEFLHGLYDGGGGAGLADFWRLIRGSPLGVGGFLWALFDEGVVRTDRGGAIDTDGNHAPDGVVGPYREREASFEAVREVMTPIQLELPSPLPASFGGRIEVENRYDTTDLAACRFRWQWLRFPGPLETRLEEEVVAEGESAGPPVPAGGRGMLEIGRPPAERVDALRVAAFDPRGREVFAWVAARRSAASKAEEWISSGTGTTQAVEQGERLSLRAGSFEAVFDRASGQLVELRRDGRSFPLGGGPLPAFGEPGQTLSVRTVAEGDEQVLEVRSTGALERASWRLSPSGWLRLEFEVAPGELPGIRFELPKTAFERAAWLGRGPSRVWRNRLAGAVLGVWARERNDTVTGVSWRYPELEGYYAGVRWLRLNGPEQRLTAVLASDDLYVGLLSPSFPEDAEHARAPVPPGLSFLFDIPAIGTKFHPATELGPSGTPERIATRRRGAIAFHLEG